jgi:hypothetical protein
MGTYTVMITDGNGCTSTGSVTVDSVAIGMDIPEVAGSLHIFPNPTTGTFTIEIDHPVTQVGQLQITGLDGKMVYKEEVTVFPGYTKIITLDEQVKGIYFIRLLTGDLVVNRKIIIQ